MVIEKTKLKVNGQVVEGEAYYKFVCKKCFKTEYDSRKGYCECGGMIVRKLIEIRVRDLDRKISNLDYGAACLYEEGGRWYLGYIPQGNMSYMGANPAPREVAVEFAKPAECVNCGKTFLIFPGDPCPRCKRFLGIVGIGWNSSEYYSQKWLEIASSVNPSGSGTGKVKNPAGSGAGRKNKREERR